MAASRYKTMAEKQKQKQQEIIEDSAEPAKVEPVSEPKNERPKTGAQRGLPDGWTRFTVTVPIELAEDMKDLAYTERLKLKDVVVRAFENAIKGVDLMRRPDRKD